MFNILELSTLTCHHFIRDLVERNIIILEHIHIEGQLVDLLTKALYVVRFETW